MGYPTARAGVRRRCNGAILVNGHEPVRPQLRADILDLMKRADRPMLASDVADELRYSVGYMRKVMHALAVDGDIRTVGNARAGRDPAVYELPDAGVPRKRCSSCGLDLPVTAFHRDRQTSTGLTGKCRSCRGVLKAYRPRDEEWVDRLIRS